MDKELKEIIDSCENINIANALLKADNVLNRPKYHNIMVSISGGADSDVMLDMVCKVKPKANVYFVFYDTGLEYDATKRHLDYLEQRYNITIHRVRPKKPIPAAVKEFGIPFKSKYLSENISRCQRNDFKWEDAPYEELVKKYNMMPGMMRWWTNWHEDWPNRKSMYNINYYRQLKEFLMINPPKFKISSKCCYYAKKTVARNFVKDHDIDMEVIGVRKAEGGVRSTIYHNCFTDNDTKDKPDQFRPLFYLRDQDKEDYKKKFGIVNSDCYEVWGMKRTGCVGCPFNRKVEEELALIKKYEPNKYKACINLFGQSYEYHKRFKEFQAKTRKKRGNKDG